jgi:hypothetical protein
MFLWAALSDERTGLSFVYAAGSQLQKLQLQLTAPLELPVIWPRGGSHGQRRFLLSLTLIGMVTDSLPSNKRPIIGALALAAVFTESLPSNGSSYSCRRVPLYLRHCTQCHHAPSR